LADDHALIRQGIRKILEEKRGLEVVGEAGDGLQACDLLNRLNPDMVILDISMPNMRGVEAISEIKKTNSRVSILILTMHKTIEYLQQCLTAGAHGYLLKEDATGELFSAIEKIREGKRYVSPSLTKDLLDLWGKTSGGFQKRSLTTREREIIKLIAEGKSSNEIATVLSVSVHTVGRHRANIKAKLHLDKTADLVRYALEMGYI